MNLLKTFQNTVIRLLMFTMPPLVLAAWFLSPVFAKGFIIGVAGGSLWFLTKVAQGKNLIRGSWRSITLSFLGGTFLTLVNMAALYAAYFLDRYSLCGCFGVLAGLLLVQAVIILIGITGWDLHGNTSVGTTSPECPLGTRS